MQKIKKILIKINNILNKKPWILLVIKILSCLSFMVLGILLTTFVDYYYSVFVVVGFIPLLIMTYPKRRWKKYKESCKVTTKWK